MRLFLVNVLLFAATAAATPVYRIQSVTPCETPRVQDGRIYYTLDIVFDHLPANYWAYYEKSTTQLTVECYDAEIQSDTVKSVGKLPFMSFAVTNFQANKSLTRQQAKIVISLDSVWCYEISPSNQNAMRLVVWQDLRKQPGPAVAKKRSPIIVYLPVALGAALIAFLTILLTSG